VIRQIPVNLPPSFEDALGYPRGFRHVAFFWEPCGDEAMYDDGFCSADCNWHGFLKFVHHPKVGLWLVDYDLGSSEDEATHWLLCDLESRSVFVGERAEVKAFLVNEIKKYMPDGVPAESRVHMSEEEMKDLLADIRDKMKEVPAPPMAEIMEKMKKDQEAVDKMVVELNA
jgi:hypothetical protein